jgi:putative aldouronate transport system permease protein
MNTIKLTFGEKIFQIFNYSFLLLLAGVTLYPFWYIAVLSFSDPVTGTGAYFLPKDFYYANYWLVFNTGGIWRAYAITILRVAVAVPLHLLVTGGAAFALTRKEMIGRTPIILFFFLTMFFSGGLVPMYMLLMELGLIDTFWVFIFPTMFGVWAMIVMKTSFQALPEGLVEAAVIDGATYFRIFFSIIIPLSLPVFATLGLFSAVTHWNDWFTGAFYVSDPDLHPLQTFLQIRVLQGGLSQLLTWAKQGELENLSHLHPDPEIRQKLMKLTARSIQSAYILIATVPVLLIYPWVQKYFVKGVLIGSIKG